jgi:predicted permease
MAAVRRFLLRLINVVRPNRAAAELDREIAAHLALLEREHRQRGLSAIDARRAARRQFGGLNHARELQREARSFIWLEDARRDVHYAARALARTPTFTAAAILTLAIGIGGGTAVFSLFRAVLLRPLPFPDPDRLVLVFEENATAGFARDAVRPRSYAAWAADNEVFESVAALTEYGAVLRGGGEPERIAGRRVTSAFFSVLDTEPLFGRVFTASEDRPGGPLVAVLSHGFWQRRFGGDRAVIGRDILLNNDRYVVIGVMPREFQFLQSYVAVWVPAAFSSKELAQGARYLQLVGRLKANSDVGRARANLDTIAARQSAMYPDDDRWRALRSVVVPLEEHLAGSARRPLFVLLIATVVVLLIATANLASLLLARTASRRQEIALRGALGASRGRVIRQLLTESILLAAMGWVLGLVLARWAFTFLEQLVPPTMALFTRPVLDGPTLWAASVMALGTGVLFGLAPALQTTAVGLSDALRSGGRSLTSAQRGRNILVVAEVGMTLVLLVSAGLLLQSLYRLRYADLGLRPEQVLTLRTVLPLDRYSEHSRRTAFYGEVLQRVERLPGVVAAGYTTSVPLEWRGATSQFAIEGRAPDSRLPYDANHRQVSSGYLQAMGIPLRHGRYFEPGDTTRAQPVVIVNEIMARMYWPSGDAIGGRLAIDPKSGPVEWRTIVGVVADVRQMGLEVPARPEMYIPHRQFALQPWFAPRDLAVRAAGDPLDLAGAIKHEIHSVDPTLAVSNIRSFDEVLDEDVAARRMGTTLLGAFAAFALLLAVVGLYGVISYFVVQHVPEIGVRIALGAEARDIVALVVGKGMRLTLAGIAVGTVTALVTTRLMASLLYGFTGTGLAMCVLGSIVLTTLAFVASYVPARRTTRLDPIAALRSD